MRRQSGFTLIELMVVIAIVAIIAAIAIPSFNEQVRRSRRSEAIAGLGDIQLKQERWRSNHMAYGTTANLAMPTSPFYTFAVTANSATGWTATAVPAGAQSGDTCGTYTFTNASGVVSKVAAGSGRCL